jgi:hypothetical protein
MRRPLIWLQQGSAPPSSNYPLKILLEGPDGFYIGGYGEPVQITPTSADGYSTIYLQGITATGPGPNDWIAGGWARGAGSVDRAVFYGPNGLIREFVYNTGMALATGHFASIANHASDNFWWATAAGGDGTQSSPDFVQGFILPNVWAGVMLDTYGGSYEGFRQVAAISPDLSYAVFAGYAAAVGPTTNPWLVSSAGVFTNLNVDLNSVIEGTCDLIGLTLYQKADSFNGTAPWVEGTNTMAVTPHTITTAGAVTTGTPFNIEYIAPDPNVYYAWDASLWIS